MYLNKLLCTLAYIWNTIALKGETVASLDSTDKLLDAARALCEIAGLYYKQKDALTAEERIAVLLVKQIEKLAEAWKAGD